MATKWEDREIDEWFAARRDEDEYDFMDNHRVALVGDAAEEAAYEEARANGCCGRYDTVITLSSGRTFMVGFNYGH